jgi:hypothetical protein
MTITYPHVRPAPDIKLSDLQERFGGEVESLSFDTGGDLVIAPGVDKLRVKRRDVQLSEDGLNQMAGWVNFPKGFLDRLDPDLQSSWMNTLLQRSHKSGYIRAGKRSGVLGILGSNQIPIDPSVLIDVAAKVVGKDAPVVDVISTNAAFHLDVITAKRDLGDPQVGDISRVGLRLGLNVAQNLAPTVAPYCYRFTCTNGASRRIEGVKIEARGSTLEEVMKELEANARIAFAAAERDVAAMYDLRNVIVPNPDRVLNRMAQEHRLSNTLRLRAIDSLPSMVEDMGHVSMFEIINAVTHLANDPKIARRRGARESLESFGALAIAEHVERCHACAAMLN